jgi:hypothetical protein
MPVINYLFRYRDRRVPAIPEHKKKINVYNACWWGWWKRPHEGLHEDFWRDMVARVKKGPVQVGLLDLDTGVVTCVTVIEVIPPSPDGTRPRVPEKDAHLVPDYYEYHPDSHAWIKILKINEKIDFFGTYSYASAPELLTFDKASLNWLVGKRILDVNELSGMNVSMWQVRPSLPADAADRLLVMFPTLSQPISSDVIQCKANTILHITDPHYSDGKSGGTHAWKLESERGSGTVPTPTLADAVIAALGANKIGLIIVTGDLTFAAKPDEFLEARHSIRKLLNAFELDEDHLVVIPGNHDIEWVTKEVYDGETKLVVREATEKAGENYAEFYKMMFRHDPNADFSMGRRYVLPNGSVIEVCGLNSSSVETGKKFLPGMGYISEAAFTQVRAGLGWNNAESAALRVLAVHHHLAITENYEEKEGFIRGYGLAVNAVRIQRRAAEKGVQLALHGHKHRAFIWRSAVYELPDGNPNEFFRGNLSIIGGGSAGSADPRATKTYFNLLSVQPKELCLDLFQSAERGGDFQSIAKFTAALSIENGRLMLGEWVWVSA